MNDLSQTDAVIHQLVEWASRQDAVRAMLITSTRAIPQGTIDRLSDYDIVLIVTDIDPFAKDKSWIQDFGDVLVVYWDPIHPNPDYGIQQVGNVIQYADGLKIDFTVWPVALLQRIVEAPGLPAELDAGYVVLLDKDNLTEHMQGPTYAAYIPTLPTDRIYQTWVEDFFSDVPYVAKCLWRDELLPAKWCLDYDMKHTYLRQMLEWRVEIDHNWSLKTGALGKGLKRYVSPDIWHQLEQTYVGANIKENWNALFATIDLFRGLSIDVAAHLGYAYPHHLDQRVTAYARKIQQMER